MPEPRLTFSRLRQLLSDLGFKEVPVAKPFVGFSAAYLVPGRSRFEELESRLQPVLSV